MLATRNLVGRKAFGKSESFWLNGCRGSRYELKLREIREQDRKVFSLMAETADDMLKQHVLATRHLIVTKDLGKSESFWRNGFIGPRYELKLREIQEREEEG